MPFICPYIHYHFYTSLSVISFTHLIFNLTQHVLTFQSFNIWQQKLFPVKRKRILFCNLKKELQKIMTFYSQGHELVRLIPLDDGHYQIANPNLDCDENPYEEQYEEEPYFVQ